MNWQLENKKRYWRVAVSSILLVGTTALFVFIGATGPKSTMGHYHAMYSCVVPSAPNIVRDGAQPLVDDHTCDEVGRKMDIEQEERKHLKHYPLENVVFYTQVPFVKSHVMSREFEFLLADIGFHFTHSEYLKEVVEQKASEVKFEIVLGYRDSTSGPWRRKVVGNVTRTLECGHGKHLQNIYTCDHIPLFELGSCHHKQYLVNLFFPSLPLSHKDDYKGLSQLQKLSLYEIHQAVDFTRLWLVLKTIFCPLSLLLLVWYVRRLLVSAREMEREQSSLIARCLAFLAACLVFYNIPVQYLSLWFDLPWLLVVKDFQQGLFIAALFSFWIIFINEHGPDVDPKGSIGRYWRQMGVVFVASLFLFVYEFCERGIQVIYPFYSLWSNKFGITIAYVFISVASLSALLYLVMFLSSLVKVLRALRQKQAEVSSLTPSAQERFSGLFNSLRFFLVVTTLVAVCSVLTVVLPSEVLLHQWQHSSAEYNVYSGILTGNYGMWNAYCFIMMWIYAPSVSVATTHTPGGQGSQNGSADDPSSMTKLLSKKSQS